MKLLIAICIFGLLVQVPFPYASGSDKDSHKHPKEEQKSDTHAHNEDEEENHAHEEGEEDHAEGEESHAHKGEEEGGHAEESPVVGKERGITSLAQDGFTLSPEAVANFRLKTIDYTGSSITVPKNSVVKIKGEVSIFRQRGDRFKRIPIKVVQKQQGNSLIQSSQLKPSDKIVTEGAGFLRIAEIATEGGVSHGHSH